MLKPRWRLSPLDAVALVVPFLVFIAVVAIWQFVFGRDPDKPLREHHIAALSALAETPPESLVFSFGTGTQVITDPAVISEFLYLLVKPEVIHYHHSHPEGDIRFQFTDNPSAYVLGRDSQVPDEYWLELDAGADPGPTLKLFRSEALTSWLRRNRLTDE
jgi:hypothetical protein